MDKYCLLCVECDEKTKLGILLSYRLEYKVVMVPMIIG